MNKLHGVKLISALLAALLIGTALPCPPAEAAATRLDPDQACSLTATTPDDMPALKEADFSVNVWCVATVDENVEYTLTPAFDELWFKSYTLKSTSINHEHKDLITNNIRDFSYACYARTLGDESGKEPIPADAVFTVHNGTGSVSKMASGADLLPGYYLVVPGDCTVMVNDEIYSFDPTLITLPRPNTDLAISEEESDTEDWVYDITVSLKPETDSIRGNVKIVKILNGYNESLEGADFVFSISAKKNGKLEYSNVVSLHFDKDEWVNQKSKEYMIYGLPVGTKVEVEEVYSGSAYKLEDWRVEPSNGLVIADDPESANNQVLTFTFWNSPDEHVPYGTSVLNHYEMATGTYGHTGLEDSTKEPSQQK